MSCCGQKRESWLHEARAFNAEEGAKEAPVVKPPVYFEYTGATGLTARGSFTRATYRFTGKGDRQAVDYRDASGMMAVPLLKKVKQE